MSDPASPENPSASASLGSHAIFVCYRRDDSEDITGRIWDRLLPIFGREKVFRDIDDIPYGVDFRDYVRETLAGCEVFLVIIGRNWQDIRDGQNRRRLESARDHVRIEIETALARRDLRIIPVLVRSAVMPDPEQLPPTLEKLAYVNAFEVRGGRDFDRDVEGLSSILQSILESRKVAPARHSSCAATTAPVLTPAADPAQIANQDDPFVNTLGMKFVPVPILGGPTGGRRILLSVWDTRVQDYAVFAKETGRAVEPPGFPQDPTHPVVKVSWEDATAFCKWLSQKEGRAYRLPSDHEWSCAVGIGGQEDAAQTPEQKSGKLAGYRWGEKFPPPANFGNYDPSLKVDSYEFTSPAGSFPANRLGLFDMSGNVWQWCEDWYDPAKQQSRVLRGGSWYYDDEIYLRSSFRGSGQPTVRNDIYGFRCVFVLSGG